MRPFRRELVARVAMVFFAAGTAHFPGSARAAAPSEKALEMFFQLGLPDTTGAKWVRAFREGTHDELTLPHAAGGGYTGNAWLVREEKDGAIELVTNHTRRLRGRRSEGPPRETADGLPQIHIQTAQLDKDLKTLESALGNKDGASAQPIRFSRHAGHDDEPQLDSAGGAVLFLAHLDRQGRADAVRKLLPKVLALAPSPEAALDAAVSLLADGRLAQASDEWCAAGDAAAFASGVEALCADFSRGWKRRDAALLLARRAREQTPAPRAHEPAAKEAADLLLKLNRAQLASLPTSRNWLLNPSESASGARTAIIEGLASLDGIEDIDVDSLQAAAGASAPSAAPSAKAGDPLAAFFARKREAIGGLARLLDDRRLLRVLRANSQQFRTSFSMDRESPEEQLKQAYDQLPRPYELGELAWALIENIVPDQLRWNLDSSGSRTDRVLAWLQEIASLSDEQLAWNYLRNASGTYDDDFRTSLSFLVRNGGAETQAQLREVFIDPAVWRSLDTLLPSFEVFFKKLSGDRAAFAEKVTLAAKTAIDEEQAQQLQYIKGSGGEEMRKHYASRASGQLKKLEQILKPRGLAEMLAEIVAADENEARGLLATISTAVRSAPPAEAEPLLYQTAAKAKSAATKRGLLKLIAQRNALNPRQPQPSAPAPNVPGDSATRAALEALLQDETVAASENPWDDSTQSIADVTASALAWPRFAPAERTLWTELSRKVPHLVSGWIRLQARALARGEAPPPRPDSSRVPAERVAELIAELGALAPDGVLATFREQSPDAQLALAEHLAGLEEWPPALAAAHLTVADARGTGGGEAAKFGIEKWQGRRLDEALTRELEGEIVKAARDGRGVMVTLRAAGVLSGLSLAARPNPQTIDADQLAQFKLKGLEGKPKPLAAFGCYLQLGAVDGRTPPIGYFFPIWKDEAQTKSWRDENFKTQTLSDDDDDAPAEFGWKNDFAAVQRRLGEISAIKKDAPRSFTLTLYASLLEASDE